MKKVIEFSFLIMAAICFENIVANSQTIPQENNQSSKSIVKISVCVIVANSGDTIKSIAEKYNASDILVAKLNGLLTSTRLPKGREVKILFNDNDKPNNCVQPIKPKYEFVKAKLGDTVNSLACRYGVSPNEVAKLNEFSSDARLKFNQTIQIPTERNYQCVNQIRATMIY